MSRSESEFGGSFSVDGSNVEVDLAEFGWPGDRPAATDTDDVESDVETTHDDDGRIRLQKALAHAGIASRRACEALITSGRVTVNGEPERELGSRIDPSTDEVRVDGVVVQLDATKRYFVLNKPLGVVSTMSDENGRPTCANSPRRSRTGSTTSGVSTPIRVACSSSPTMGISPTSSRTRASACRKHTLPRCAAGSPRR